MKFTRSAVSANAYVAVWMIGIGIAWCARARVSPPWTESVFGPAEAAGVDSGSEGVLLIEDLERRGSPRRRCHARGPMKFAQVLGGPQPGGPAARAPARSLGDAPRARAHGGGRRVRYDGRLPSPYAHRRQSARLPRSTARTTKRRARVR